MRLKSRQVIVFFMFFMFTAIGGCSDGLYEDTELYSAHEIVTRENKAEEMVWSFRHAGLSAVAIMAGAPDEAIDPKNPEPGAREDQNEIVLKGAQQLPGTLIPFVTIPSGTTDPLGLFKEFHKRKARGLALWRLGKDGERPLDDPYYEEVLRYLEIHGIPLFVSLGKPEYLDELDRAIFDHPNLKIIGGGLLGLVDNLPLLARFLELHSNLYVDIGFDGDTGFEKAFSSILKDEKAGRDFFEMMQGRVLFAGGLTFDHRLYRRGQWGNQIYRAYRSFLEKPFIAQRLRDEKGKWTPVKMPALALGEDQVKKIYNENFKKVIGMSFHDPTPSDLPLLKLDAPTGWSFDPTSPNRLLAALVSPKSRLASTISTQRLRDVFAGKLTDWREINGEPGALRIASFGPLARIIADQLAAPLVAPVVYFEDAASMTDAIEREGDLLGIMPVGYLNGRLEVMAVDGENPTISSILYCATKAAPTISNYFSTYPLLVPITLPSKPDAWAFDPFEVRTVLIGGEISQPAESAPSVDPKEKDLFAARMRPVYDIFPTLRKADFVAFLGRTPSEHDAFLLRVLGARALLSAEGITKLGTATATPAGVFRSTIRGKSVTIANRIEDLSSSGINILVLPSAAGDADITKGLEAGADVVFTGETIAAAKNIGAMRMNLGKFLGPNGAKGAFVQLSFIGDRFVGLQLIPVVTENGLVQKRFGEEARTEMLAAYVREPQP